jgi:hypothetical protein
MHGGDGINTWMIKNGTFAHGYFNGSELMVFAIINGQFFVDHVAARIEANLRYHMPPI